MAKDWYPGNPDIGAPVYPLIPTVRVVDGGGVRPKRWHLWDGSLREALDFWEVSGLRFTLQHGELDPRYPWVYPGEEGIIGVMAQKLPEGVNGVGDWVADEQSPFPGGGYAVISKRRIGALWELHQTELNHQYAHRYLRHLICHEVGHALGFAHGGTGVMAGAWRPNAEEYAALKEYYGL